MPNILVAGKLHPAGKLYLDELKGRGYTYDYVEEVSEESYQQYLGSADGLVIRTQPCTSESIAKAQKLKVVSRHGVGFDSVDVGSLNERKIPLMIVGDVNSRSVAEHAMALLMGAYKRMIKADNSVRTSPGGWNWRNQLEQQDLYGKKLLIIGYGRIGQHLAKMANGLGLEVSAYDPFLESKGWPEGSVAPISSFDDALAWADCISVHIPKSDAPLIGEKEFSSMKTGVVIADTSRGGVICQKAMVNAIESGKLGAAGLDVFIDEPISEDNPLLKYDNLVLSPHIAGLTLECAERMALASIQNVVDYLEGIPNSDLIVNRGQI